MTTLKELAQKAGLKLIVNYGASKPCDWNQPVNDYRLKIRRGRKSISFDFYQGLGINHDPKLADVLDCLLSDASADEDFEYFCREFGYDTDSRKAEKIHKGCLKMKKKLQHLLAEDFEEFLYAERD